MNYQAYAIAFAAYGAFATVMCLWIITSHKRALRATQTLCRAREARANELVHKAEAATKFAWSCHKAVSARLHKFTAPRKRDARGHFMKDEV